MHLADNNPCTIHPLPQQKAPTSPDTLTSRISVRLRLQPHAVTFPSEHSNPPQTVTLTLQQGNHKQSTLPIRTQQKGTTTDNHHSPLPPITFHTHLNPAPIRSALKNPESTAQATPTSHYSPFQRVSLRIIVHDDVIPPFIHDAAVIDIAHFIASPSSSHHNIVIPLLLGTHVKVSLFTNITSPLPAPNHIALPPPQNPSPPPQQLHAIPNQAPAPQSTLNPHIISKCTTTHPEHQLSPTTPPHPPTSAHEFPSPTTNATQHAIPPETLTLPDAPTPPYPPTPNTLHCNKTDTSNEPHSTQIALLASSSSQKCPTTSPTPSEETSSCPIPPPLSLTTHSENETPAAVVNTTTPPASPKTARENTWAQQSRAQQPHVHSEQPHVDSPHPSTHTANVSPVANATLSVDAVSSSHGVDSGTSLRCGRSQQLAGLELQNQHCGNGSEGDGDFVEAETANVRRVDELRAHPVANRVDENICWRAAGPWVAVDASADIDIDDQIDDSGGTNNDESQDDTSSNTLLDADVGQPEGFPCDRSEGAMRTRGSNHDCQEDKDTQQEIFRNFLRISAPDSSDMAAPPEVKETNASSASPVKATAEDSRLLSNATSSTAPASKLAPDDDCEQDEGVVSYEGESRGHVSSECARTDFASSPNISKLDENNTEGYKVDRCENVLITRTHESVILEEREASEDVQFASSSGKGGTLFLKNVDSNGKAVEMAVDHSLSDSNRTCLNNTSQSSARLGGLEMDITLESAEVTSISVSPPSRVEHTQGVHLREDYMDNEVVSKLCQEISEQQMHTLPSPPSPKVRTATEQADLKSSIALSSSIQTSLKDSPMVGEDGGAEISHRNCPVADKEETETNEVDITIDKNTTIDLVTRASQIQDKGELRAINPSHCNNGDCETSGAINCDRNEGDMGMTSHQSAVEQAEISSRGELCKGNIPDHKVGAQQASVDIRLNTEQAINEIPELESPFGRKNTSFPWGKVNLDDINEDAEEDDEDGNIIGPIRMDGQDSVDDEDSIVSHDETTDTSSSDELSRCSNATSSHDQSTCSTAIEDDFSAGGSTGNNSSSSESSDEENAAGMELARRMREAFARQVELQGDGDAVETQGAVASDTEVPRNGPLVSQCSKLDSLIDDDYHGKELRDRIRASKSRKVLRESKSKRRPSGALPELVNMRYGHEHSLEYSRGTHTEQPLLLDLPTRRRLTLWMIDGPSDDEDEEDEEDEEEDDSSDDDANGVSGSCGTRGKRPPVKKFASQMQSYVLFSTTKPGPPARVGPISPLQKTVMYPSLDSVDVMIDKPDYVNLGKPVSLKRSVTKMLLELVERELTFIDDPEEIEDEDGDPNEFRDRRERLLPREKISQSGEKLSKMITLGGDDVVRDNGYARAITRDSKLFDETKSASVSGTMSSADKSRVGAGEDKTGQERKPNVNGNTKVGGGGTNGEDGGLNSIEKETKDHEDNDDWADEHIPSLAKRRRYLSRSSSGSSEEKWREGGPVGFGKFGHDLRCRRPSYENVVNRPIRQVVHEFRPNRLIPGVSVAINAGDYEEGEEERLFREAVLSGCGVTQKRISEDEMRIVDLELELENSELENSKTEDLLLRWIERLEGEKADLVEERKEREEAWEREMERVKTSNTSELDTAEKNGENNTACRDDDKGGGRRDGGDGEALLNDAERLERVLAEERKKVDEVRRENERLLQVILRLKQELDTQASYEERAKTAERHLKVTADMLENERTERHRLEKLLQDMDRGRSPRGSLASSSPGSTPNKKRSGLLWW